MTLTLFNPLANEMARTNKLEIAANLVIVVTGVVAVVAMISMLASRPSSTRERGSETWQKGDLLTEEIAWDFSTSSRTVVLILSSTCSFCTASMPFYEELSRQIHSDPKKSLKLVVAGLEPVENLSRYLAAHQVTADHLLSIQPSPRFGFTPMLIIADRSGRIVDVRRGQLREQLQLEVLDLLKKSS